MVYLVSDLHGMYHKFLKLLDIINFSESDELYILGDICDRGPHSAQIYLDIIERENVHCVLGNHEKMLLEALPGSFRFLENKYGYIPTKSPELWNACGGDNTCESFVKASEENGISCEDVVVKIYEFIAKMPYYLEIKVDGDNYLLLHAGLTGYDRTKPLDAYKPDEFVWGGDFDIDGRYYDMQYRKIIIGHTPTYLLNYCYPARIAYCQGNVVDIDCGAVFSKGRLGCLCLNTWQEFYVD